MTPPINSCQPGFVYVPAKKEGEPGTCVDTPIKPSQPLFESPKVDTASGLGALSAALGGAQVDSGKVATTPPADSIPTPAPAKFGTYTTLPAWMRNQPSMPAKLRQAGTVGTEGSVRTTTCHDVEVAHGQTQSVCN